MYELIWSQLQEGNFTPWWFTTRTDLVPSLRVEISVEKGFLPVVGGKLPVAILAQAHNKTLCAWVFVSLYCELRHLRHIKSVFFCVPISSFLMQTWAPIPSRLFVFRLRYMSWRLGLDWSLWHVAGSQVPAVVFSAEGLRIEIKAIYLLLGCSEPHFRCRLAATRYPSLILLCLRAWLSQTLKHVSFLS